jgi:hypothetical protein
VAELWLKSFEVIKNNRVNVTIVLLITLYISAFIALWILV